MTNLSTDNSTKPCLVKTAQGFTVFYKQKYLYSKYNPTKSILQIIENLSIQPQTIILCISPVLPYGLKELSEKLPDDCIMLGCELETELTSFIKEHSRNPDFDFANIKNFSFLTKDELFDLGPLLLKKNTILKSGFTLPQAGRFRRIIKIEFSAAAQFNSQIYDKITENATNALMTFWANRVTLVKFGRKYCTNFFKNLAIIDRTTPIQNYFRTFEKAIIVFGAGESAAKGIEHIKKSERKNFYILCADTALQPLIANKIIPDGVFIEEAQNVISKCFIGIKNTDLHIFAGLSSIHSIIRFFAPEQISFFTTEFTQAEFLDRFEKAGILPPKNAPFGSVGITTWYYATLFRKDSSIPIYTYGLDFAYSAGRTHTKGTMADKARFLNSNRIRTDGNFGAAFNAPAFIKINTPTSIKMYTTPILERYAQLFMTLREPHEPQTFDQEPEVCTTVPEPIEGPQIKQFLQQEHSALLELKALLTGETKLSSDKLKQEITKLAQEREYLYLHFPDGQEFQYSQSFLNRVRVEIEYYLKIIEQ